MLDVRIPKCDIQIQHSKIFKPYLVLYSLHEANIARIKLAGKLRKGFMSE